MKHDIETLAKLKIERHEPPIALKPRKRSSVFRGLVVFVVGGASGAAGLIYADGRFDLVSVLLQPVAGVSETRLQSRQDVAVPVEDAPEASVALPPVMAAAPAPREAVLEATGYVRALRRIHVVPQVGGKVEAVYFDIGEQVEKGDVLASLDDDYGQIAYHRAELSLKSEQVVLSEIELSLGLVEARVDRNVSLSENGLVTLQTLQEDEAEVAILKTRVSAQQLAVKLADADLQLRELELKDHLVRAAFSGVIVERFASPGDYVSPASSGTQSGSSQGLATLVDTTSIDAVVDVSEKHISQIQLGQPVIVSGNGADIPDMPGRVSTIIPMVDRGRATVKILIKLDEHDAHFIPDMSIRVRFLSSTNTPSQGL